MGGDAELASVPVAYATAVPVQQQAVAVAIAQPMGVAQPMAAAVPMAAPVAWAQPGGVAGVPTAQAAPMPHGGTPAPMMRQNTMMQRFQQQSRKRKIACAVVTFIFVGIGVFMFIRTVAMGCGCPSAYEYSCGSDSSCCSCSGDIFSCEYNCGNGICFSGHDQIDCSYLSGGPNSTAGSGGGAGTVLCPTMPEGDYCDCGGDCGGSFCTCDEANAASCCGSG